MSLCDSGKLSYLLSGDQDRYTPWCLSSLFSCLSIFTQLPSSFRALQEHTHKKCLKQLQNPQTNKCSDARHNHYSANYHKILLGPETQGPKDHYCMRYMRAKVPLAQDFNCSKTGLEKMNPLVLREKQESKKYTKEKHKPPDCASFQSSFMLKSDSCVWLHMNKSSQLRQRILQPQTRTKDKMKNELRDNSFPRLSLSNKVLIEERFSVPENLNLQ